MNFFASYVSPKAKEYVAQVLDSGMLSEGEWVRRFEQGLEKELGLNERTIVATNSGTSALHLALATLGIGSGHEVIIPPLTFVATGLAVLYAGATPVFCDIGFDGCINPEKIASRITPRTRAIIAVNWAGYSCDIKELEKIAKLYGVKLIVDAAQSFGVGIGGDITCLSFQAIKHLTTGDGGAVICRDSVDYELARKLSWFGINKDEDLPDILGERVYNLDRVGYKYHMNNVAAAIGLGNLEGLQERQKHRHKIADIYEDKLMVVLPIHRESSFWAYPIQVNNVQRFSSFCMSHGVPTSSIHRGIDRNFIFGEAYLPNMRQWERHTTHLPIHHEITEQDARWICERINEYA